MCGHRLFVALAVCLFPATVLAGNAVLIESKSVPTGADSVTIGIYISNDAELMGVVLPIQIRSVTAGAFIRDTLALDPANRLSAHLIGYTVKSYLPDAGNNLYWKCGGGGFSTRGAPDFVSPDAFFYAAVVGEEDSTLMPGNDGTPPGGAPSMLVQFAVTSVKGTFELDTTCITPANHLMFIGIGPVPVTIIPSYTKGVITIDCDCLCHADPYCDGRYDIIDWMLIRDVSRGTHQPIPDSSATCPELTTDVNCDGVTNTTDRSLMYGVVFLGDNPDSVFCDPCP